MPKQNKILGLLQKSGDFFTKKKVVTPDLNASAAGLLEAIGTKSNISSLDACVTRIRLIVIDNTLINEAKLKQFGATKIIKLDANNIQIVVGTMADPIVSHMKSIIENS